MLFLDVISHVDRGDVMLFCPDGNRFRLGRLVLGVIPVVMHASHYAGIIARTELSI